MLTGDKQTDFELVQEALDKAGGVKREAAAVLSITESKLYRILNAKRAADPGIESEKLRRQVQMLTKKLKDVAERRFHDATFAEFAASVLKAHRTVPVWVVPKGKPSSKTIANAFLSDIHYYEIVRPEQVFNLNAYNSHIADMRLHNFFDGVARISNEILPALNIQGVVLAWGGDMFSGDIHNELIETNEGSSYEALLRLSETLSAGLRLLADAVGRVHVVGVPGNHARSTHKPQAKNYASKNLDWLLYHVVARDFKKDPRVSFEIGLGTDYQFKSFDWTYHLTHGDQAKGGGGAAGGLGPVLLMDHKKRKWAGQTGNEYDYLLVGHWHSFVPQAHGVIMNGSVVGYSEYSIQRNFPYQPPQQGFWITHPTRGVTYSTAIFLEDANEGWRKTTSEASHVVVVS